MLCALLGFVLKFTCGGNPLRLAGADAVGVSVAICVCGIELLRTKDFRVGRKGNVAKAAERVTLKNGFCEQFHRGTS